MQVWTKHDLMTILYFNRKAIDNNEVIIESKHAMVNVNLSFMVKLSLFTKDRCNYP